MPYDRGMALASPSLARGSTAGAGGARFLRSLGSADWWLVGVTALLAAIGLIAVWSYSPPASGLFSRQLLWFAIGAMACLTFALMDYRIFRNHGQFLAGLYLAVILLLLGLLLFAPETRGVQGWFRVGSASLQPVELAKLALVIVLAKYFSRRHMEIARLRHLFISGAYAAVAIALVLLQPDLGSALILAAVWLAMVIFAGIRLRHLVLVGALGAILAAVAWTSFFAPYQKERVFAYVDPYRDPQGAGYNVIQSMIAAGSGQWWGKGIGYGTQSHLNFLPEAETDFIFAAFAEETGFIGAAILVGLFAALLWRIVVIGRRAQDNFAKLFALGFASFLFFETFVHISINLGLLPVTGIALPLISYGGSSLITTLVGIGIVESVRINSMPEVGYGRW